MTPGQRAAIDAIQAERDKVVIADRDNLLDILDDLEREVDIAESALGQFQFMLSDIRRLLFPST